MRYYSSVDVNGKSETLSFHADTMAVINTTKYTLAVRVGSAEKPANIGAATLWFPPDTMCSVPVEGNQFGMSLVAPTLPDDIPGLPTTVQIMFLQGELQPTFSAAPLTSLAGTVATETLIVEQPSRDNATSYSDGPYLIPAGTRSLKLQNIGNALATLYVVGQTTNYLYLNANFSAGSSLNNVREIVVDFNSLETLVKVNSTQNLSYSGSGYRLIASRQPYQGGQYDNNGAQVVNVMPNGKNALPTAPAPADFPAGAVPFALASRSATATAPQIQTPWWANGINVYVHVTATPGAGNLQLVMYAVDPSGGGAWTWETQVLTTTGTFVQAIGRGNSAATEGNVSKRQDAQLPRNIILQVIPSGGAWTFSLAYEFV